MQLQLGNIIDVSSSQAGIREDWTSSGEGLNVRIRIYIYDSIRSELNGTNPVA